MDCHAHELAVLRQEAGKEDDDEDLGKLAGLEAHNAGNLNPQLGAVVLGADEDGQDQKDQAHGAQAVLVAGERLEVAHPKKHADHGGYGDEQPYDLLDGKVGREARYKRDAYASQHKDDGQDGGVGVGGRDAHGDVRDDKCHGKADGHDERAESELVAGLQHVERVQYEDGYGSRYEQEQLGGASLRHGPHAPSGEAGWSCSVLPAWVPSVLGALACLLFCSSLARSIWER